MIQSTWRPIRIDRPGEALVFHIYEMEILQGLRIQC